MTDLEMNEWFAMNGKWTPDCSVEVLYQAFKARLMAEGFQSVVYEGEKS